MSLLEESHEVPLSQAPLPAEAPAPVDTYTLRREVGGTETELVVQSFDDRILVVVTQSGKVGCLTQASLPAVHQLLAPPADEGGSALAALPPPVAATSLTPLLGSPPDAALHDLYVSQIATLVWWSLQLAHAPRRPVIVGLALKRIGEGVTEGERTRFGGVMDMVASWPGPQ